MSVTLSQPTGTLLFSYSAPLYQAEQSDGTKRTLALGSLTIGVLFFLENLLYEGGTSSISGRDERSIQQDQLELFKQIEDNISSMGVDGHACVLRFICELQTNRFSKSSLFGELFTLMFTPKRGDDYTLLKEYIEAEMVGQERRGRADEGIGGLGGIVGGGSCLQRYYTCPMSVFSALRSLQGELGFSTPADKPINASHQAESEDNSS